jgi:hypothetical protein
MLPAGKYLHGNLDMKETDNPWDSFIIFFARQDLFDT